MAVLSAAILISSDRRRRFVRTAAADAISGGGDNSSLAKERGAIVTMTIVALINVFVFLPTFVTTTMNNVVDTSGWSADTVTLLGNLERLFENAVCIAHWLTSLHTFVGFPVSG